MTKEGNELNVGKEIEESQKTWRRMFDVARMFFLFRQAQCERDDYLKSQFFDQETGFYFVMRNRFIEGMPLPSSMYESEEEARAEQEAFNRRTEEIRHNTEYWVKLDGDNDDNVTIKVIRSRIQGSPSMIMVDINDVHTALRAMIESRQRAEEEEKNDPLAMARRLMRSQNILLGREIVKYLFSVDSDRRSRLESVVLHETFSDTGDSERRVEESSWSYGQIMHQDTRKLFSSESFNWYSELMAEMQHAETYGREHYEEKGFPLDVRRKYLEILTRRGFHVDRPVDASKDINLSYKVSRNGIVYPVIKIIEISKKINGTDYVFQLSRIEIPVENLETLVGVSAPPFPILSINATIPQIDEVMRQYKPMFDSWLQEGNIRERLDGIRIHPDMLANEEQDDDTSGEMIRLDLNTETGEHAYRVISRMPANALDNRTGEVVLRDEAYTHEDPSLSALKILMGLAY